MRKRRSFSKHIQISQSKRKIDRLFNLNLLVISRKELIKNFTLIEKLSSLSSKSFASNLIEPPTISDETINLTKLLLVSITTVSDKENSSLHIRVNSPEFKLIIELYLVSGIPKCSESIVINDKENSLVFFCSKKLF